MKSKHATKPAQAEQGALLNIARTIGSTLGTIAAKTGNLSERPSRPVQRKKTKRPAGKTRKSRKA
jgi:hypothetical protein